MRPLPQAPTLAEALTELPKTHLPEFVASFARPAHPYLPWDDVRFRTPPEGLTHRQWWAAIKLGRSSMLRTLPLLQLTDGAPLRYALPDDVQRLVDRIGLRAGGTIGLAGTSPDAESRDRYITSSLIEEAITSSQLEGAATTSRVARELLRSGRDPDDRSEQMIVNNYRAMTRIRELRAEPFTPDLVREIHRIVTEGTLDDPAAAGRLQSDQARRVHVATPEGDVLHTPPPVDQLHDRLERLCSFANGEGSGYIPPVLRSIAVHFMAGYDHYFEDGNGRTARALFYWSMLREGYWLAEFLTISPFLKNAPAQYARSFEYVETDEGDLTYFFVHHLRVLNRALDTLEHWLDEKSAAASSTRQRLKSLGDQFNHRQIALLGHALNHPGFTYTGTSHARSHNVSLPTALSDLHGLADHGLLTPGKRGRRFVWTSPHTLSDFIAEL